MRSHNATVKTRVVSGVGWIVGHHRETWRRRRRGVQREAATRRGARDFSHVMRAAQNETRVERRPARPILKESSLPWVWPRSLGRLAGLSLRSVTPPPDARGPPSLFFRLSVSQPSRAWLALDVQAGTVTARVDARPDGSPPSQPAPLYESEVVPHSLHPSWMLDESVGLRGPARMLRNVVVSVHQMIAAGQSECLWERRVCFDSLVCATCDRTPGRCAVTLPPSACIRLHPPAPSCTRERRADT